MSRTNTPAASQASQRQRRMRPTAATQSKGLDCLVLTCGRLHKSDHEVVVVRNQNARTTMLFYFVQAPRHVENWQNCQSARKSAAWRHYSGVRECVYELEPFVYWPSCARVARRGGTRDLNQSPNGVYISRIRKIAPETDIPATNNRRSSFYVRRQAPPRVQPLRKISIKRTLALQNRLPTNQ